MQKFTKYINFEVEGITINVQADYIETRNNMGELCEDINFKVSACKVSKVAVKVV